MNEGTIDRVLRIFIGVLLLGWWYWTPGAPLRWVGLIGVLPLVTGLIGVCPLYSILGIRTCPARR